MLKKENIFLNQEFKTKQECLDYLKSIFKKENVDNRYIESIDLRERVCSFNIGSKIAIPHGTYDGMLYLKNSLIIVLHLQKPIIWDDSEVQLIIGLALKQEDQIDILSKIAINAMNDELFEDLLKNPTVDKIIDFSTKE
ncbi:PTS sugar transporter subunit IIA [Mycoplasma capricolum subsp. capripneumoniae]|uniref:Mannitol-specific phosphotransferase enzyme IIA component n=1 Tax=Mycoplasma capricolum subsp. capripneumoniae 87001 TaxID=1124992 RepID=A0A9N7B9D6_MYCCC|nr:PTS sugar transporter subunit IIA [Mycoplasma capricolum]AJK51039.1 PTS fructose transporter subunit IIA [Mycoplasma capricolum subsp. capripneumoniae 87001]AOQ21805.1 PTS fructose transporter subunit IIA [Mycoplasma capricolum subsp. capripneumoniae M1601]KEY84417.1 Phosphotransferase system PTS, mannitol-specific IIA component [Mycoplasma capricolum subsp. capripneumoniae 99108]QDL19295.1 PTS sugar transporter subunit IIA [Mycoplasma capricolum subsp. capripneumoniae]QDL19981.1 PTS sugar 